MGSYNFNSNDNFHCYVINWTNFLYCLSTDFGKRDNISFENTVYVFCQKKYLYIYIFIYSYGNVIFILLYACCKRSTPNELKREVFP